MDEGVTAVPSMIAVTKAVEVVKEMEVAIGVGYVGGGIHENSESEKGDEHGG